MMPKPVPQHNGHAVPSSAVIPEIPGTIFHAGTIVTTLQDLMTRVTEHEVTPETVMAACRCASEISQILRLHLEAEKLRRDDNKVLRAEMRRVAASQQNGAA